MAAVNFSGKWKEVRSENQDALMIAMKLPEEIRVQFKDFRATLEVTHNGDEYHCKTMGDDGTVVTDDNIIVGDKFKTDVPPGEEEYISSWEDGGKVLRTKSVSKDGLVMDQMIADNGELVMVSKLGDVISTTFYAKA